MIRFAKNLFRTAAILFIILFSIPSNGANVQPNERLQWRSMIIIDKNGHEFDINLSDQLNITFSNDNMVITNDLNNLAIEIDDISEWKMSERLYDEDALSDQRDIISNSVITIAYFDNHIKISSAKLTGLLTVVDTQGLVIKEALVNENTDIDVSDLAKGMYLVCFGNKSMKIIIR